MHRTESCALRLTDRSRKLLSRLTFALGVAAILVNCSSQPSSAARQSGDAPSSAPTTPASAPFDPLSSEYPQVFWMLNVYEVPGAVEVAGGGVVTSTTKGKPNTFAALGPTDIDASFASIEKLAGRDLLSAPAVIAKFDQDARVEVGDKDKAGQILSGHSISLRSLHAKVGIDAIIEVMVKADNFSISARTGSKNIPDGGALVMATPGPRGTDPWTIVVARPRVLHSVKDYPFQTSGGLHE